MHKKFAVMDNKSVMPKLLCLPLTVEAEVTSTMYLLFHEFDVTRVQYLPFKIVINVTLLMEI